MLSTLLLAVLVAAPHVSSPSLDLSGGARVATYSGALDWSLCADGDADYPCAATEATVKPAAGVVTVTAGASKCWGAGGVVAIGANDLCQASSAGASIWSAAQHSNALPTSTTAGWTGAPAAANDIGVDTADTIADAAGPDGSATSASKLTAGVGGTEHYATQNFTGTAVAWDVAFRLKVEAGWGFVSPDGGTSGTYVNRATCALGTAVTLTSAKATLEPGSTWCRVEVVKTLTAATYAARIYIAEADNDKSFTAAGTETLTFYAPQAQTGVVAGPPTPSAGTPVVGAADVASVAAAGIDNTRGAVGACFTTEAGTLAANTRILDNASGSSDFIFGSDANTLQAYDGTSFAGPLTFAQGAENCIITYWSGATLTIENLSRTQRASTAYDGSFGTWTAIGLGSNGGSINFLGGRIRKVCQARDFAGCRKALQ